MKALTIQQPFAELISRGQKRVENRRWFTSYRGPLAIHAGKGRDYLQLDPSGEWDEVYGVRIGQLPFGAIVATCDLVACLSMMAIHSGRFAEKYPWLADHEHTEGPVCFILENVKWLATPIPCKGAQGLWDWKGSMESEVARV